MSVPKSVVKFKKGDVTYNSNVEACQFYIHELTRAALRDVGKFIRNKWKTVYYAYFTKHTGDAGKAVSYIVISSKTTIYPRVEVGLKTGKEDGFYAYFQEFGTSRQPKLGLLTGMVEENVNQIIEIESQYLSALNKSESEAESLCNESEYSDDGE